MAWQLPRLLPGLLSSLLASLLTSLAGPGLLAAGAVIGVCAGPAAAQLPLPKTLVTAEPPATPPAPGQPAAADQAPDPATIEARRREVSAEREALAARIAAAGGEAGAEPGLTERVMLLERLERSYGRQLDALRRRATQGEVLATLDRQLANGPGAEVGSEPPFPIDLLDRLLDSDDQKAERTAALGAAVAAAEESVEDAKRTLEKREAERRAAKEAAGSGADDPARAEAERVLRRTELASEIARQRVLAEELALATARQEVEIERKNGLALAARIAFVEERLALGEDELTKELAGIEQQELRLREEQPAAAQAVRSAERRLDAVQKRADAEPQPGPALLAELDARRIGLVVAKRHEARLADELERLAELRRLWQERWRVVSGGAARDELRTWARELPGLEADHERDRRLVEARIADVERERTALAARAAAPAEGAPGEEQRWLAEQARELDQVLAEAREQLTGLAENERLTRRLRRALGLREQRATLADRAADAYGAVASVWSKELVAVEDNPITIGKVTTAILLFGLGIVVSRLLSRGFAALVRRRSALDEGAVDAIRSLAFYALVALFFLVALDSVNIPLTAFTVAGGAIAIGIAFGSQAVVNNFVSGLILMIERPIKVGDMVVYADNTGRVERIGPRSTRIRTIDNVYLIVPNSKLLDNNVVNWTLSDGVVRTRVTVGVTYGTPTRDVEKLLLELMAAQPEILAHPRPAVVFDDFAADSLRFHAEFFVKLSPLLDDRAVRSRLRHAIDETFRRRGIVIAYPVRDLAAHVPGHSPPQGHA